jgi:hypothetical protein
VRPHDVHIFSLNDGELDHRITKGSVAFMMSDVPMAQHDWHYNPETDDAFVEYMPKGGTAYQIRDATERERDMILAIYGYWSLLGEVASFPEFDL